MGRRAEERGRAASDDVKAATHTQGDGERDRFAQPEVSLSEMREVLLAELLDVPALQIWVWLTAALSVPVLRPRQQMVSLDLQSYQEDPPGAEGHAEQALLIHSGNNTVRYANNTSICTMIDKIRIVSLACFLKAVNVPV